MLNTNWITCVSADVPQSLVETAEHNLESLKETCDVTAFRRASRELDAAYNADKQTKIDGLRSNIRDLEDSLKTIKADDPPPEATP